MSVRLTTVANNFQHMGVLALRELLWERGLVPGRWVLTYMRKLEAIECLESNTPIPPTFVEDLRQRQETHMTKALNARKDRADRFGVERLTSAEILQRILHEHPNLEYAGTRLFPDGFESATGYRRGKHAIVVSTGTGELLLTKGEAQVLSDLGVRIPFSAFTPPKAARPVTAKTMRDMF